MHKLLQAPPPKMLNHQHEFDFVVPSSKDIVWKWLNTPETFTKGQIPPFKVEFYSPDPKTIPNGFHEGVLNAHHGPLMNFSGVLGEIKEMEYRDLQYFYGSYAISMRWIRPYRLEFWLKEIDQNNTEIKCRLSSYTAKWISSIWTKSQSLFWASFRSWAKKSCRKLQ